MTKPYLYRMPSISGKWQLSDSFGLGALLIVNDGNVSMENYPVGQVWHRGLLLCVRLLWLSFQVQVTSPFGRLVAYEPEGVEACGPEGDETEETKQCLLDYARKISKYLQRIGADELTFTRNGSFGALYPEKIAEKINTGKN